MEKKHLTKKELLELMEKGHQGLMEANKVFIEIYKLLIDFKE